MLQNLVADYASKAPHGTEINLAALAHNAEFRAEAVKAVEKFMEQHAKACVLLPSYGINSNRNPHLAQLTNELAASLAVKSLVTGSVEGITNLRKRPTDVVIIKQAFRTGEHLEKDIEALQKYGCKISVLCLVAHSSGLAQGFAHSHGVEMTILVKVDEIRYLQ